MSSASIRSCTFPRSPKNVSVRSTFIAKNRGYCREDPLRSIAESRPETPTRQGKQ